jgi:hypothetical protein
MKMAVFWVIAPYKLADVYPRFTGAPCLTMEAENACETWVNFYRLIRGNNPEDSYLNFLRLY